MARRHGWELPAHPFQVVAITVFFLLCVAFYAFLAPFLGNYLFKYIAISVYSSLALYVFMLYVRSTAIDPADPGILVEYQGTPLSKSQNGTDYHGNAGSTEEPGKSELHNTQRSDRHGSSFLSFLGGIFCGCFVKEDCRKDVDLLSQQDGDQEALFCTLCNAEVRKFSKHCRSCDKCVDGFDHHCRWLNNCIGRKNYITFFCLMAASLVWLIVEFGVGVVVLVRCFVDRHGMEHLISNKLGVGLTQVPFILVVVICTVVSCLATVPLGQLFFFHLILIRKGITTYEYIVAMRTQSELLGQSLGDGDRQSLPASPTSSTMTAISGRSSLGKVLPYKGAWCTPPQIFMDHQDEIIPHLEPGRLPSTVDPDAQGAEKDKKMPQKQVRISAWKLAMLDSNEAIKAGAKARASSSVLRPVGSRHHPYDPDHLSSSNVSARSSPVSSDQGFHVRNAKSGTYRGKSSYPPSRAGREDTETCGHSVDNMSSPQLSDLAASPLENPIINRDRHFNLTPQSSADQSLWSSAKQGNRTQNPGPKKTGPPENTRSSVFWDQEAGRFVSSSRAAGPSQIPGRELLYTGQSIFFGGPLVNKEQLTGNKGGAGTTTGTGQGKVQASYYQQGRLQRGGQLPVFLPSDYQQSSKPPGNEMQ